MQNLLGDLATEATLGAVSGALQGQLQTGVYDNNNSKINPATSDKQLPDGHNVAISDLNPTAANQLNAVLNEKPHCEYTWTDGKLTTKVATYLNRVETTTYTWVDGLLYDKITVTT